MIILNEIANFIYCPYVFFRFTPQLRTLPQIIIDDSEIELFEFFLFCFIFCKIFDD